MTIVEAGLPGEAETSVGGALVLEFGGRRERIPAGSTFIVGRSADLSFDDNQYVHRRFLEITQREGIWRLTNIGSGLTASVASADGMAQSWLAPGASMPLVFGTTVVMFTAGETMYEFSLTAESPFYEVSSQWSSSAGDVGDLLSPMQRILLTALAEPMLRLKVPGSAELPGLDVVAHRLRWTREKLERRVVSLCGKFARHGVRGLERDAEGRLPDSVRSRLVEHAVGARIVTSDDLDLLDAFAAGNAVYGMAS
ncbi:hypothetical protein ACI3KS_18405 [Microbacterium sp. ZW T5_45]|uniref:hypothetical protein n=1 Tax=Microbacterium sp. ZW T5_45 TaxID=3378080 RepID=UPI003854358E